MGRYEENDVGFGGMVMSVFLGGGGGKVLCIEGEEEEGERKARGKDLWES